MKLFLKLQEQTSLPSDHKFVYSVLKRLCITEAFAANQFQPGKPSSQVTSHDFTASILTISHENRYTKATTQTINDIFLQIERLSQLIAEACFQDWVGKTQSQTKKIAITSAKSILPETKPHLYDMAVKNYLQIQSMKIIERLNTPSSITNLDIIKTTLIRSHPNINQNVLNEIMSSMTNSVHNLTQEEWINVEQCSNVGKLGVFGTQSASHADDSANKSICVIS